MYYKALFYAILYYSVEGQRSIKILRSKMDGSCTELMFFIAEPQTGLYIPVALSILSWWLMSPTANSACAVQSV
jgi:hypothetical protein